MALHLLFEIVNPDFGPNSTTEPVYINVYWDDVLNNVDADYISIAPFQHTRTGELSPYKFCDGTTLTEFTLTTVFPYAVPKYTYNATECLYLAVCDAYIQEPLILRPAGTGFSNGSVTVRGYTTKPAKVEGGVTLTTTYSLNGGAWQASPTFSGLAAGTYTVTMKDVAGCTDSKTFEIETEPEYGVRFTTTYKDYLGQSTRIDILKRDYVGLPEEVRAAADPLIIKERADGMFTEIRGQECVVSLLDITQDQYIELFTGDDREYKVQVHKDLVLFWSGWLVPDVYNAPYLAAPYAVSFSATDGLGELKDRLFHEVFPEGFMSQWDVLLHILAKTNANLPIYSGVNLYETRMNARPEDEPFKQAVVSMDAYHDYKEVQDCATVLTAILRSYGAFIRQYQGAWHLVRVEELKASYIRRYYNANGIYLSRERFTPNRLITTPGQSSDRFFWVDRSQALELRPAFRKTEVHLDYGLRDNIIRGGDMNETDFETGYHKYLDGPAFYETELIEPKEKKYQISMLSDTGVPADYIQTERVYVKADPLLSMYFKFEYKITAASYTLLNGIPPDFGFSVHLNDKMLNYPLVMDPNTNNPLVWRNEVHRFTIPTTSLHSWQTAELFVPNIPEDGWLTIRIYEVAANNYQFVNQQIKRIVAVPFRSVSPALAEDESFVSLNPRKQFYAPAVIEAAHGDVIPLRNAPAIYKSLILINGTVAPSLDWFRRGKSESKPILKLLADTMLALNETAVRLLRGTLKGSFEWDQVIQEPSVLTRYMPIGFEYNDKQNTISSEFMELLGTTQPPAAKRLLLETGEPILMEDGTYIAMEQ